MSDTPQRPKTYDELKAEMTPIAKKLEAAVIRQHQAVQDEETALESLQKHIVERFGDEEDILHTILYEFVEARRAARGGLVDIQFHTDELRPLANAAAVAIAEEQYGDNINKMPSQAFGADLHWLTVAKRSTFTIHDNKKLAEWLLLNNRADLISIGGSVSDKEALIKAGVLPRLEDGTAVMTVAKVPTATISPSAILKALENEDATTIKD